MGRGKIKKIKPVSLQARKAAIAQQQQLQAQKAALERQIAEERSKQARLQREIEEKERLVRGLERVGAEQERAFFENQGMYEGPEKGVYLHRTEESTPAPPAKGRDALVPISDKALSMLNHMLGNRGLMQRDPTTGAIDVVLNPESLAHADDDYSAEDDDGTGVLDTMNGILARNAAAHLSDSDEGSAETREALAEAMAAMKAAAHVAKALPLMMLKTAAQAMASGSAPQQHGFTGEGQMVIDPMMMDEHLTEFRAMMEDPEERARLGVGFEMLGWAMGEHPASREAGNEVGPLPTLEEMLKLPIFNNEAFRSSPMFGKPAANNHQPHPTSGELFLESTDSSNPVDLHNLDMMSDFLSSAPAMLGGPLFGGTRGQGQTAMSTSMAMRQVPTHPPSSNRDDYPGDLTATEAVKAVTQLLEASSRKLQRVTEDQGGEESRVPQRNVDAMNVRLDRTGQRPGPASNPAVPPIPVATAQAILQARARELIALEDEEDSDIDAFSVDGDVEAFDEDDEDEAYYSDEEYDDEEEYDEDGATYDGEESDYSHDGGSSCYDSEADEADDEEHYPVAEVMPFHAPIRRKHADDPTNDPATRPPNDPSTPPRPHYSTIPYLPGSRRNPVTGKQMREILDRLSPAARHNYQQALIREHQLEMEVKEQQEGQPLQQQIPPPQNRQPSVLDDPVVMDQAVDELFSWIKAVIWTIEQHAIRAARAQMEAKGVGGASGKPPNTDTTAPPPATAAPPGKPRTGPATWTPKATPDGERMRAMMRTVGIDVAPA